MNGEAARYDALIASDIAGRLRIRLRREARSEERMTRVVRELGTRTGISSVEANSRTGSITVQYDEREYTRDAILAMLRDLGVNVASMAVNGPDEGLSTAGSAIAETAQDLDRRLLRLTGHHVDLRVGLPLTFTALGLWGVVSGGLRLSQVAPTAFFWYAFSSFCTLNKLKPPSGGDGE